jgi:cytochrome oxidase Cu insertion factor (SCO1/SenC/PrrC family)
MTDAERNAALAEPPPKVPRQAVIWTLVACMALGFGGLILDHFFGGPVGKATPIPTGTDPPTLSTGGVSSGTTPPNLQASIGAMMDLQGAGPGKASAFSLVGPAGRPVSLSQYRGKAVVLSFFDSRCDDVCPVLERELSSAMTALDKAADGSRVEFLAVNTDPLATSVSSASAATKGMLGKKDWQYLTGSLHELDSVWKAYGITVEAQPASSTVSHTNVLYFIDPDGKFRAEATPFANEVGKGKFTLPSSTIEKFATGLATETEYLLSVSHR